MAERRVLYAIGPKFNLLARCASPPTFSPSADTLFPATYLSDGLPDRPARFGSVAADPMITWDLNEVANNDMTLGTTEPTSWTEASVGTGNMTRDATGGESGGPGLKLASGAGSDFSYGYQDVLVAPGEVLNWSAGLMGGGGSAAIILRVQNRLNLKFWTGSAWQVASANLASRTTASFATSTGQITMEDWADLLWPELGYVPLRILLALETASSTAFADNVTLRPSWSGFSVHHHALQPQLAFELRRDTAAFAGAGTLVSTMGVYRPSFFYALADGASLITDRYLRVKLAGTPSAADWFGEMALFQYRALTTRPLYGATTQKLRDQVRFRGAVGSSRARMLSSGERRIWNASFQDMDPDDLVQFDEQLMGLGAYGASPGVFILDDEDPRSCLHGMIPEAYDVEESSLNTRGRQLSIMEDPPPSFVS